MINAKNILSILENDDEDTIKKLGGALSWKDISVPIHWATVKKLGVIIKEGKDPIYYIIGSNGLKTTYNSSEKVRYALKNDFNVPEDVVKKAEKALSENLLYYHLKG